MVGLNRRKSVMGNGRLWGKGLGTWLLRIGALGAVFVLVLAGLVLLGLGSRRSSQKALAGVPASPVSISARSSLAQSSRAQSPLTRSSLKPQARTLLGQLPLI